MTTDINEDEMLSPFEYKTLKLDAAYRPIGVISGTEALVMCLVGKARMIEAYDKVIRSTSKVFKIPSVIILSKVIKFRFEAIHCNRKSVFTRDEHVCQYCTKTFGAKELTLDHVVPKSRGGEKTWTNIVAAKNVIKKREIEHPKKQNVFVEKPIRPKTLCWLNKYTKIWKDYLWY